MASYKHITTNTTTAVCNRPTKLLGVVINTVGATGNTLTLYDNPSAAAGNVICTINTTAANWDFNYYGLDTLSGLTAVTANGTAADITIVFE